MVFCNSNINMDIDAFLKNSVAGNSYLFLNVTKDEIDFVEEEKRIFVVNAPVICTKIMPLQFYAFRQERSILTRPAYRK